MAEQNQPRLLSQQVSNTLQTLSSRPGVESTLILSRKDGNIIRVTGALEDATQRSGQAQGHGSKALDSEVDRVGAAAASVKEQEKPASDEKMVISPAATSSPHKIGPTRVEKLASDIFHFVSVASYLTSSLHLMAAPNSSNPIYQNGGNYLPPASRSRGEEANVKQEAADSDEVQLLRMRSKKYEVIIFPDPNFLCCVVQNMDRQNA